MRKGAVLLYFSDIVKIPERLVTARSSNTVVRCKSKPHNEKRERTRAHSDTPS